MGKIITKQNVLCFALELINLFYVVFIFGELGIFGGELNFGLLYVPGLVSGLLILPIANIILWTSRSRIERIDYTFIAIPLFLWLLVIPGGSGTNFIFINFPLIWFVSLIYLFRFSKMAKDKNTLVLSFCLWTLIILLSFVINYFIPILPE